jgi:hypothetical protein
MVEERMELWTDDTFSEFGLKFNSKVVVKTSEIANLIKMIDESPYKDGYDYDWHYTLSQWVIFYLSNKYAHALDSKVPRQKEFKTGADEKYDNSLSAYQYESQPRRKPTPKPVLKCHFCNLKYCLDVERKDHEEFWHSDKLSKTN